MEEKGDQIRQRIKKLQELRALGIDPYGQKLCGKQSARTVFETYGPMTGEALERERPLCTVAGRIVALRRFGKAAFAHLLDATGKIQVYFKKDLLGEEAFTIFEKLDIGDLIGVTGHLFRTKTGELTLSVEGLVLLAKSLRPLPEKWHGLQDVEARYRQRYLDLIATSGSRETFLKRSMIISTLRSFLDRRGFLEVETPMMHPIPGGATARPFITHHNALDCDLYLRIAPELYLKRLIVGGFEKVYEINRNFRNEGISTVHNPEFTMLEFYMAYADYMDLIPLTEELITTVTREIVGGLTLTYQGEKIDLTPPWKRVNFIDSIAEATGLDPEHLAQKTEVIRYARTIDLVITGKESTGKILQEIFEATVEPTLLFPTFVLRYPTDISPLAKRSREDPGLTDRFELFIGRMEIANAFSELNDPEDQRNRFEEQVQQRARGDTEAHQMDEEFLQALEYGMPPTAGEGIGIDRLVMLLTDRASLRDVILFPQLRPEGK